MKDHRSKSGVVHYQLPIPEPIKLWKWAARNSQRADGLPLSLVGFYKRAVRRIEWNRGEDFSEFVKRALRAETQAVVSQLRCAGGGNVPDWVESLLAKEMDAVETRSRY